MKIHHVGYAVEDIDRACNEFIALGFSKESDVIDDPGQNTKIQFLMKDGHQIELVAPGEGLMEALLSIE